MTAGSWYVTVVLLADVVRMLSIVAAATTAIGSADRGGAIDEARTAGKSLRAQGNAHVGGRRPLLCPPARMTAAAVEELSEEHRRLCPPWPNSRVTCATHALGAKRATAAGAGGGCGTVVVVGGGGCGGHCRGPRVLTDRPVASIQGAGTSCRWSSAAGLSVMTITLSRPDPSCGGRGCVASCGTVRPASGGVGR